MSVPVDQLQRERLSAELGRTLFVEAGAGSGKTTQLVRRVVELVTTGALGDIAQLAAITFTEAAAAELRDRIREALEQLGATLPVGSVEGDRVRGAVERLDEAVIATLHGFAFRLLADFPIEAGLPPGFEVADEIAAMVTEREQWADFVDDLFDDATIEPVLKRALLLGLTLRNLYDVAREFADNWDRLEHIHMPEGGLGDVDPAGLVAALDDAIRVVSDYHGSSSAAAQAAVELPPFRDALVAARDADTVLELLQFDPPDWPWRWGNAKAPELVAVKETVTEARRQADGLLARARLDVLLPLAARIRRHTLAMAEGRRRDGVIRFHDLLVLTRQLLVRHPGVRQVLGQRHQLLLIDEFQDTDPLQIEIALLLALEDPLAAVTAEGAEHESLDLDGLGVAEGRLFFVGDPKQSIYRFRRADIEVFERAKQRFSHHGVVELSVNFRSVPSVLAWVNAVFAQLIGDIDQPGQPAYRPLEPARADLVEAPAVALVGGRVEARSVAEVREREAEALAATIAAMPVDGWVVQPTGDGPPRSAQFRDITILIPGRVVLGEIEKALGRHDVPYRIESRSLVFGTDEVRELLAILQAVDDPNDEVAVIAALRSPAFACSDADLARFTAAGGRWNYRRHAVEVPAALREVLADDDPVLAAFAALNELHEQRVWRPVNELIDIVVRDRRMVELTTAHDRPRDHWRRLRLVQDEARAFVEAGGLALGDFIAHIDEQADEKASRVETVVSEADDDAVRILTIHGSKGLEFPIVVLAGLGTEDRVVTNRVLWTGAGPEIALGPERGIRFETEGYAAVREREVELDRAERTRLLYVATTRARDHLVVGMFHKSDKCAAARLDLATAGLDEGLVRHLEVAEPDPAVPGRPAPAAPALVQGPELDLRTWRAERAELLARAARRSVTSPTAIAARARDDLDRLEVTGASGAGADDVAGSAEAGQLSLDFTAVPDAPPAASPGAARSAAAPDATDPSVSPSRPGAPGPRGTGLGTAVGRAVHATLQLIDLDRPDDLPALAAHHATAEGIEDRAAIVEKLASSALRSPSVAAARSSGRYWRELFVSAPLGTSATLVEGYIDLLYETIEGELVVVDYKTDQGRDDAALAAAADRYRLQAATYAAVVESALGRPVARCVFVFARSRGPAVEQVVTDVADAVREVLAELDRD